MLIGDMLRFNARRFTDKVAFEDEKRKLTFEQTDKRANALASALLSMGVQKGDRIAVLLYNCAEYNELLFALPKTGFVMVPLNYRLVGRELTYIINNSEANTFIFGEEFTETVETIRPDISLVKNFIVMGRKENDAHEYERLIHSSPTTEISTTIDENDVAYILYTSGTTGQPKGVMLTHKNTITNLMNFSFEFQPHANSVLFNPLPLYHIAADSVMMPYFFFGCTTITLRQFDAGLALTAISDKRPNVLHLVPAMQNMLTNHPDVGRYDFSFVDLIPYGGSPVLLSQLKRSMEIFGCRFLQLGGQTETSCGASCLRPEDHVIEGPEHVTRRLGSAGRELKLTETKIVDQGGNEVPPNTPGEEIVRGDNVMKGYWKLPEATAETIVNGWLHTGDICLKDEGGYIYYIDRIKDMIVRGGENVYAREIEEVIATHPAVTEVAVIGVPDERLGEEIMAVVALKKDTSLTDREIVTLCEKNLARFKKPRYIEFVDTLPKNASGKILKRELRNVYKDIPLSRNPLK
jgi:acyl-CoA synthetase (AMP-forming)/AMP-acid ligase II